RAGKYCCLLLGHSRAGGQEQCGKKGEKHQGTFHSDSPRGTQYSRKRARGKSSLETILRCSVLARSRCAQISRPSCWSKPVVRCQQLTRSVRAQIDRRISRKRYAPRRLDRSSY